MGITRERNAGELITFINVVVLRHFWPIREEGKMSEYIPIRCPIHPCPIGKNCCFGEAKVDPENESSSEQRYKCKYAKATKMKDYVTVTIEYSA